MKSEIYFMEIHTVLKEHLIPNTYSEKKKCAKLIGIYDKEQVQLKAKVEGTRQQAQ